MNEHLINNTVIIQANDYLSIINAKRFNDLKATPYTYAPIYSDIYVCVCMCVCVCVYN